MKRRSNPSPVSPRWRRRSPIETLGNKDEAKDLFEKAYSLYCLFWAINMKIVDTGQVKKIDDEALSKHDETPSGFFGKLRDLIKRAIDCCIE
jgi:hypothetical protein